MSHTATTTDHISSMSTSTYPFHQMMSREVSRAATSLLLPCLARNKAGSSLLANCHRKDYQETILRRGAFLCLPVIHKTSLFCSLFL